MKLKRLSTLLILCLCTTFAFAQKDESFKTITLPLAQDTTFDRIIDYLQGRDIFIQSVDKRVGFIQGKRFLKQKKMLSAKAGERMTMNFVLRPVAGARTKVTLNIYIEEYNFGGDISARSYYYEDKGVSDDEVVYRDILSGLQKAVDQR